jgi:peptide-methionine (S)-S-oxide reductase
MKNTNIATLGGGCFWCIEAIFERITGVSKAKSGYMGGSSKNPTYEEVCSGATGYAEVVEIHYDKHIIDFEMILKIFFSHHDPTTLNKQGGDIGTQYRSIIFYHDQSQRDTAEKTIENLIEMGVFKDPIVTELAEITTFYDAESYHQSFYNNNRYQPYCQFIIDPKLAKLRSTFSHLLKPENSY